MSRPRLCKTQVLKNLRVNAIDFILKLDEFMPQVIVKLHIRLVERKEINNKILKEININFLIFKNNHDNKTKKKFNRIKIF